MNQINVSILLKTDPQKSVNICSISKDGVKVGTEIEHFI
jgi:hypothetical protein